jgi:serine/threonine protein phosphatase PrpC
MTENITNTSAFSIKFGRAYEDRCVITTICNNIKYFAVFDGHGYPSKSLENFNQLHVVTYVQKNLHLFLSEALSTIDVNNVESTNKAITGVFTKVDKLLFDNSYIAGSTAIIVLVTHNLIYQINLGDSRCVIFNGPTIISESSDLTPDRESERKRIESLGGIVCHYYGAFRINADIAISRSFGDFLFKLNAGKYNPEWLVSVIPEITIITRTQQQWLVLGSDGLYEGFNKNSKQLVDAINVELSRSTSLDSICKTIVTHAEKHTTDDITMILALI